MSQPSSRTAVIVDERPLWLDALEGLLMRLDLQVVGRTTKPATARGIVTQYAPDLVIVDYAAIADPDAAESTLLQSARQANPNVCCLVLSESDDPLDRERAFAAGATVFCVKRVEADDLASAIRQSFEHSVYFATSAHATTRTQAPADEPAAVEDDATAPVGLTKREIQILRLAAEGYSNSQLARMLWVTEQTVKFHLSNIYRKLGVANRTEASRWAQRNGLLNVDAAAAA
jgi:DNA-binding NarL/FixJ family response regulator